MRANIIIAGGLLLFIALVIASPRNIRMEADKKISEHGVVAEVYGVGIKDLVLKLKGTAKTYYLNDGLNQGFSLPELKDKLINKKVTIEYPEATSPINHKNQTKYITQLEYDGQVIYAEDE